MPSNKPAPITMDAVYTAPGYLFRRMQQIAVAIFVEECKAFDLTPVQYAALVAIHTHPGIDATRLSAVIAFDRSTLGNVIERLQSQGPDRAQAGARGQARQAALSHQVRARRVLRDIMPSVDRAQARMLQPLKPADRKTLLALLTQLGRSQQRGLARAAARRGRARTSREIGLMADVDARPVLIAGGGIGGPRCRARPGAKGHPLDPAGKGLARSARSAPASSSGRTRFTPSTISASARRRAAWLVYIDQLRLMDALTAEEITHVDLREAFRARFGNPYAVVHRGDLHGVFLRALPRPMN